MTEPILHHYPISTYSEQVRLAFGLKRLSWRSVTVPAMMPKPDLLPLTAGYRRAPVMQVGADVYCDTELILRTIDRLHPEPGLYPNGSQGVATAIAWWAGRFLFPPALGVMASVIGDTIPADFVAERKAFGFPLDKAEATELLLRHRQQGAAHLTWLAAMLADGRPYLLGDTPSAADLAVFCPVWLLKSRLDETAQTLLPLTPLDAWYGRVAAIGHGDPVDLSAEDALVIARASEPEAPTIAADADPSGLRPGTEVVVTPDDTGRDPIRGTLLAADSEELVIRSTHPRVGEINIHFPRAGYDVIRADA